MGREWVFDVLVDFFLTEFQADPVAVGEWLTENGQDVDEFISFLEDSE